MDRVRIDNELPGSATYYMAESPHEYGERIYEIERMNDIEITSVRMDVGREAGASWREVKSAEEYHDLIWKTSGGEVFSCEFDVIKLADPKSPGRNFPIKIILDFLKKRITLQVDPALGIDEKRQLKDFFEMLTDEDYYIDQAMDQFGEELAGIKHLSIIGKASTVIFFLVILAGFMMFGSEPETGPNLFTIIVGALSLLLTLGDGLHQYLIKRALKKKIDQTSKSRNDNSCVNNQHN